MKTQKSSCSHSAGEVLDKIGRLFHSLIAHDGYGDMRIEVRILKRRQKEVIVHCGKQYRYVLDCVCPTCQAEENAQRPAVKSPTIPEPNTAHQINDFH